MKRLILMLLISFSLNSYATEVPAKLRDLMQGQSEHLYQGKSMVGTSCEVKVYENGQGFHIDAYERNLNGEIDVNYNFGRFILNDSHELEDFLDDAFGIEAVSLYFSDLGASFDRKAIVKVQPYTNGTRLFDLTFKKHNGYWFYTNYHLECIVK